MFCQYCGKQAAEGMNFCQYCGKPLQPVKAETSAADAAPGGKAAAEEETAAQREAVSNKSGEAAPTGEGFF